MTPTEHAALAALAESWRTKATNIEVKHGRTAPNTVKHCVAALETCAEEIEDFCRRYSLAQGASQQSAGLGPSVEPRI